MLGQIRRTSITFLIIFFLFLAALLLTSLIPSKYIKKNLNRSVILLKSEGVYPSIGPVWRSIVLDNYTDPLILNTAYSISSTDPLKSALINYRYMESKNQFNQIINLEKTLQNKTPIKTAYERYWHGYLIYLRPLLVFFSYNQIRLLLGLLLYGGYIFLSYLLFKKLGILKTFLFFLGMLAVDFFHISKSIQFSSVFLIGIFSSIYLVRKNKVDRFSLFFIVGGLTSYFDLLTAPLVSLGILLIVDLFLNENHWLRIIKYSLFWSLGYLSLWASKWVIVTFLYAPGSIFTSLAQVVNRTVVKPDLNFTYLKTLQLNIFQLIGYHKISKIIFLAIFLITVFLLVRFFKFDFKKIRKLIPWIVIGTIPYLWYLIAANHSYLHVWYTYRNQFMTVVAGFMIVFELVKPTVNRRNNRLNKI